MNVSAFDEEDQPGIPNQRSANDQPLPDDDQEIDLDEVIVDQPDEYYAILNLSRSATHDQITKRYKQLAALLHPDRHPTPSLKSAADSRFQAISRAHEVLSDPTLRVVYDSLGIEGLKTSWEVGPKYQTPDQLREQFERLGRLQREKDVENLVKSRGDLTCILDARVLLLSASERTELGGPPSMSLSQKIDTIKTKQLVLKNSFTIPVDPRTNLTLTGQLLSREGVGAGNLFMKLNHRPNSKLSIEIGTTVLRPRSFNFKANFAPDSDSFLNVDIPFKTLAGPPPITLTIGRRITEENTATFTIRSGPYSLSSWGASSSTPSSAAILPDSTVSLGLINNAGWSIDASSGVSSGQLSGNYQVAVLGNVRCTAGGTVTSFGGVSAYVGAERKVGEEGRVRVGLQLEVGMNQTMTFKIKLQRLGQKITLPIIISSSISPKLIVAFTVVPAVSMLATHYYVIIPKRKRRVSERIVELRQEHQEFILAKKKEAEEAIDLLREHVAKRREVELACNGLVILEATYGILDSGDSTRIIDVTIPLQSLITNPNPQLSIPAGRAKSSLLGFYDCALSEKKRLRIKYLFKGREHLVEVDDKIGIALPLRAHLID